MTRTIAILCLAALMGTTAIVPAQAQSASSNLPLRGLKNWTVQGEFSQSLDFYENRFNPAASPNRFEGWHYLARTNLLAERRYSPYEKVRAQFFGRYADSDYAGQPQQFLAERASIVWEKGDAMVPFRAELGDFFAFVSQRTQVRSLKGARVDLQPRIMGLKTSLQLYSGVEAPFLKDIDAGEDVTSGLSWAVQARPETLLLLNVVHNHQNSTATRPALDQTTTSLGATHRLKLARQELALELEAAHMRGDQLQGATLRQDVDGFGYFSRLTGKDAKLPLDYSLQWERYSRYYAPNGAAVSADRRAAEARAGWRFKSGMRADARYQDFVDGNSTTNPTLTRTVGATLSGPFKFMPWENVTGSLDSSVQTVRSDQRTVNRRIYSNSVSLNAPLSEKWTGRFAFLNQRIHDRVTDGKTITRTVSLGANRPIGIWGWQGNFSGGVDTRLISGSSDRVETDGNVAVSLVKGGHSLEASYRSFFQLPDDPNPDVNLRTLAMQYGYRTGRHQLFALAEYIHRDDDAAADLDAYHLGFRYNYAIGQQAETAPAQGTAQPSGSGQASFGDVSEVVLLDLFPLMSITEAEERLALAGIQGAQSQGCCLVYEARVFNRITPRQRVVLVRNGEDLERSAVLVDLQRNGGADLETYNRLLEILVRNLGDPSFVLEQGQFGPNTALDLSRGDFVRLHEWTVPSGRIRLGVPRRLDGLARIEIQHARTFPPRGDARWSIEEVQ